MTPNLLLLVNAAATWFMVGLIWFVQIVHYPLFSAVGERGYTSYQIQHMNLTGAVVGPPMVIEALTALWLVLSPPPQAARWEMPLGLGLLVVIWIATAAWSVPRHSVLAQGFDADAHAALVLTNWLRTILWTARGGLIGLCLWRGLNA